MSVNILEGTKAERMAAALENLVDIQSRGHQVDFAKMIIMDYNLLKVADWGIGSIGSDGTMYRYSALFDMTPNVVHALWAPKLEGTNVSVRLVLYDGTGARRFDNTYDFNSDNDIVLITPQTYYTKGQIGILPTTVESNFYQAVFFGELTAGGMITDGDQRYVRKKLNMMSSAEIEEKLTTGLNKTLKYVNQGLSNDEKAIARENIGAIGAEEVNEQVTGVVKYTEQELEAEQKEQARNNIGAISAKEVNEQVTGVVKYTEQELEAEQKEQARNNIGAISAEEVNGQVTGVVKYTEQELEAEQKEQARNNIGAISAKEVNEQVTGVVKYTEQELEAEQKEQARNNINAAAKNVVDEISLDVQKMKSNVSDVTKDGDTVTVHYANNTVSEFKIEAAGLAIASIVYDEDYQLHFYDENEEDLVPPITIKGGSGGEGGGTAYITRIGSANQDCVYGEDFAIEYNLVAKEASGEDGSVGKTTLTINGSVVNGDFTSKIGDNRLEIGKYLQAGTNTVKITVEVNVGTTVDYNPTKSWSINATSIYFEWNYNSAQVNKTSFTDNWTVYGNTLKTMHTRIDGENELDTITTRKSNETQSIIIPMLSHGAHSIEHWLTAQIGEETRATTPQYKEAIFDDGISSLPIIALTDKELEVDQYTTVQIGATVYDPNSMAANAQLYVDGVHQGDWVNVDRSLQRWAFTPTTVSETITKTETITNDQNEEEEIPVQWKHQIAIVCGEIPSWVSGRNYLIGDKVRYEDSGIVYRCTRGNIDATFDATKWEAVNAIEALGLTVRTMDIFVNALNLNVAEVPGYTFRFKSSEFASNSAVQNWSSNGITAQFSDNFDWINGGLHTEMVDEYLEETNQNGTIQQYFCIKAGTRMTINHKLFKEDPKNSGMTFKIIFKVKNCRDYEATVAECYNGSSGIRLYAHRAIFNSSSKSITIPYDEDAYMELEMDLYPIMNGTEISNTPYMLGWLDGVMTTCRTYESKDLFAHSTGTEQDIVIGSDDCDVYIYMVKAYPFLLNTASNISNHMSNFIMDAPNTQEMNRRYKRNDILGERNEISYVKLMEQNPDLRIWLYDIPYMTNNKSDKVGKSGVMPKFEQFWPAGDSYYHLTGEGLMSVQGTSSVKYIKGAANTDFNFRVLHDGDGNDLLANGVQGASYGESNNWYYADPENPTEVKVFTREEALDETNGVLGAEWVVVERDENRNPTKYIKALGFRINDDSCPITYSNTKVNFASCEQVNNMCNAIWYQRFNPYPSLTARDCMEFNMGVQFIRDAGNIPDSEHFTLFDELVSDAYPQSSVRNDYHMYSIANMGNSKKNVHVFHDLSNPKECCIEVKDSTEPQHRMITDDLSAEQWNGEGFFEMRYPDTKNPDPAIREAWQTLLTWFATNNPQAATGEPLLDEDGNETSVEFGSYTFRGHDRAGTQVLKDRTVTQYAGVYDHDTFEYRMAKMLSECEDHLVMDSLVYHYIFLERHTMIDNVAKNNFWSSTDLEHWDVSKAYDMDTADGNDNQGKLVLDYGLEYNDTYINSDGQTRAVFNGPDSVWFVFVANLYEACQIMFNYCDTMAVADSNGELTTAWSAKAYRKFLRDTQRKVPERCWNQCYWYDYLRPHEQNITSGWLEFLDGGQKTHQRSHYEQFQELYVGTKYHGGVSTNQNIRLNASLPAEWGGVVNDPNGGYLYTNPSTNSQSTVIPDKSIIRISGKFTDASRNEWRKVNYNGEDRYILLSQIDSVEPKAELTVSMYARMYLSIDNGTHTMTPIRVNRGEPYAVNFGEGDFSNAMIYVNTASMVQSVEGIEQLYITEGSFDSAIRLREITVGTTDNAYFNTNLTKLSFTNNRMLERLNAQNLPTASSGLNMRNCQALRYIDTTGSSFTGYEFADGGLLETAILQSPTTLSLQNLNNLKDWDDEASTGLKILDYSRLAGLFFEYMPSVDALGILNAAENLTQVRILGINWTFATSGMLARLYNLNGYDGNGITTARAVLSGTATVETLSNRELMRYREAWSPDLYIPDPDPERLIIEYPVHFANPDNSYLPGNDGEEYIQYVARGSRPYDPYAAGEIPIPTQESTKALVYQYSGWDGLEENIYGESTIVAKYTSTPRTYKVQWFLRNNSKVPDKSITAKYGDAVFYDEKDPYYIPTNTDAEDSGYYQVFAGWDNSTGFIDDDVDVHAIWEGATLPNPNTKTLDQMTPAEIYAISQQTDGTRWTNVWDQMIEDDADERDTVWLSMDVGIDFDFGNVDSKLICENTYFDKTNMMDTGIALFDENAESFTLAIDFEMTDTTTGATLISCYDPRSGGYDSGLRIASQKESDVYKSILTWGGQRLTSSSGTNSPILNGSRCMLAISHRKGSSSLFVAYNAPSNGNFVYPSSVAGIELVRTSFSDFGGNLTFGGMLEASGSWTNTATGWIHWCKIWYGDLGTAAVKQLAAWPHETWKFAYIGAKRYQIASTVKSTTASFIGTMTLPYNYTMNNNNTGGWCNSPMRTFVNSMCLNAVPYKWRSVFKKVSIPALEGGGSSETVMSGDATKGYTGDYFYLPAYSEIISRQTPYSNEGSRISTYVGAEERARFAGRELPKRFRNADPKRYYNDTDDPARKTQQYPDFKPGDIWFKNNTYWMYVSPDDAATHSYICQRQTSASDTTVLKSDAGGIWIMKNDYYTRTPNTGTATGGFYYVSSVNNSASLGANTSIDPHGVLLCFSI